MGLAYDSDTRGTGGGGGVEEPLRGLLSAEGVLREEHEECEGHILEIME